MIVHADRMDQYRRGEFVFDVIDEGPAEGVPVVLLHGFPQFNTSWDAVIDRLVRQGYRCIAPNQRGYSPGARPPRRRDYRSDELVADILALIDAVDAEKVHLVGHDAGATVAWAVAARAPERLVTLTAMSVPHPAAFLKAMATSRQALASWYVYFFQLPLIPEAYLLGRGGRGMTRLVGDYAGQSREALERDARGMAEPGVMTAALHWYRAVPFLNRRDVAKKITVPTMFIWSDGDVAIKDKGVRDCGKYVSAEYRFETLHGTHWMLDEQPDAVAELLVDWLAAHPS